MGTKGLVRNRVVTIASMVAVVFLLCTANTGMAQEPVDTGSGDMPAAYGMTADEVAAYDPEAEVAEMEDLEPEGLVTDEEGSVDIDLGDLNEALEDLSEALDDIAEVGDDEDYGGYEEVEEVDNWGIILGEETTGDNNTAENEEEEITAEQREVNPVDPSDDAADESTEDSAETEEEEDSGGEIIQPDPEGDTDADLWMQEVLAEYPDAIFEYHPAAVPGEEYTAPDGYEIVGYLYISVSETETEICFALAPINFDDMEDFDINDIDDDGDGIPASEDLDDTDPNVGSFDEEYIDYDGDGEPDMIDPIEELFEEINNIDSDGDGIPDNEDDAPAE